MRNTNAIRFLISIHSYVNFQLFAAFLMPFFPPYVSASFVTNSSVTIFAVTIFTIIFAVLLLSHLLKTCSISWYMAGPACLGVICL